MSGANYSHCPHCQAEQGDASIMVKVLGFYDGGLFWKCPQCFGLWHRFGKDHPVYPRVERALLALGWPRCAPPYTEPVGADG